MTKENIKISFVSLGCDKNLVDSEIMLGLIDEEGYTITPDEEAADIIIVNTCGFIGDATQEGIDNILRLAEYKSGNCKGLIATGCMVQRYKEDIFKELPEIDAIVGTSDFEQIGAVIKEVLAGHQTAIVTDNNTKISETSSFKRILSTPGHFAYLKIAEGCDNFCTYCTIPSIRGKYRSRTIESLVAEANILVEKGVHEIVIVAQDTTLYGSDIYGEPKLHELLHELGKIPDIEWIRVMYAYPENVTDEIINEMATNKKVCHYLDMPIQHASDPVLKKMGRRSSAEKIRNVVKKLRSAMPDIAIRTTIIVGFPGETDADFNALVDFVNEIGFDRLGVFKYSQEEGTPAAAMADQIDDDIKAERETMLMDVQKNISRRKCDAKIGLVLKIIVEGKLPEDEVYMGRSYMDAYDVDGLVFFKSDNEYLAGDFVDVQVTEALDYDLIGDVLREYSKQTDTF